MRKSDTPTTSTTSLPVSSRSEPITGYSLPVWVTAVAMAACHCLRGEPFTTQVPVHVPQEATPHLLPVQQAAPLGANKALAMGRCQPGDHLDLTRDLPIWVLAEQVPHHRGHPLLQLLPGAGIGIHADSGKICASNFALELLHQNLEPLLPPQAALRLTPIFPTGARLAERTSNRAFGVVDGLALLGMGPWAQASAAPDQLAAARQRLAHVVEVGGPHAPVVLVLGANGWDLARRHGLPEAALVKVGNWIGPLLVEAAERGCRQVLLWGYHGKLLKLAGGIFHTHHHIADGRAAVLTAFAALEGLAGSHLQQLHSAPTVEAALNHLRHTNPDLSSRLEARLLAEVEQQAQAYVARHGEHIPDVGVVVFDGHRQVRGAGPHGQRLLNALQPPKVDSGPP